MKQLILSCKKATYYISLREEGKLSFTQQLQLRAHLTVCRFCRLFQQQTAFITKNATHSHNHSSAILSKEKKEKMSKLIKEITTGD
jgi:hypothetical protein